MSHLVLKESSIFAERYRVGPCIAMGGMGAVYEVIHLETERRRALKVMLPHIVASPELRDRFKQEARIASHIDSEHIVDVFDAGCDAASGLPYLVMELLRGEELGKRLKRVGRFTPRDVVLYLEQTGRTLDKTHRASIVHRDFKPENLFLTEREDGTPHIKILDFGIAKFLADGASGANATRSIGTPLYMAPEQFNAGGSVGPASDIFALGMVAFTMLVGVPYWQEDAQKHNNVFAFADFVRKGPEERASVRASRLGIHLSAAFDSWFEKTTAHDPKQRFASAGEAAVALGIALGVRPRRDEGIATVAGLGDVPLGSMTEPLVPREENSIARIASSLAGQTPVDGQYKLAPMTVPLVPTPVTPSVVVPLAQNVDRPLPQPLVGMTPSIPSETSSSQLSRTVPPESETVIRERRRMRTALLFGAIATVFGIGGIVVAVWRSQSTPEPTITSASVQVEPKGPVVEIASVVPSAPMDVRPVVEVMPEPQRKVVPNPIVPQPQPRPSNTSTKPVTGKTVPPKPTSGGLGRH